MKRSSFTLIEMLVVLVITGILLGLAIPAFERLTVGSGVDAAARMVGAQLRLTRQYAITSRSRVALLMPGYAAAPDVTNGGRYFFTAIRPCQVDAANNFVSWIPNTKWETLPVGAVIAEADTDTNCSNPPSDTGASNVNAVDPSASPRPFTNPVRAIIFKPNGQLSGNVDANGKRYVSIIEGFYGGGAATNCVIRNASNLSDIAVDQYTGRVSYE